MSNYRCTVCANTPLSERGELPTTCRACGYYPTATGGGHGPLCPRDGQVHYAIH